jgi:hypothetical protein
VSSPTTALTSSSQTQFARFATVNFTESIASDEFKANLYDIAAKVATVAIVILILTTVAGVATGVFILNGNPILAAFAGGLALSIGVMVYRMSVNGLISVKGTDQKYGIHYLKQRSTECRERAKGEEAVQVYADALRKNGSAMQPTSAAVIGRLKYWQDLSTQKEGETALLKERIKKHHEATSDSQEKSDLDMSKSLDRTLYNMEIEQAAAKIHAAYIYYICYMNDTETRPLEKMVIPQPMSYEDHRTKRDIRHEPTPLLKIEDREVTVEEVVNAENIAALAALLFPQMMA